MQASSESTSVLTLPRDVWTVIVNFIHLYDTIFLRASSKWLNKLCKEIQPFPRFHVLDQDSCMDYLVENGFISLLDYVKDVLHFSWASRQCSTAIKSGQLDVLKHLQANGCLYDEEYKAVEDCTQGTCSLDMLKYLHENGITWELASENSPNYIADMARHGHIECIKYAIQTGCKEKTTYYTPSIECLDFLLEKQFDWDGPFSIPHKQYKRRHCIDDTICEEAARRGDLTMLKYAHQQGAKLNDSARRAMENGHLDCLIYALEHQQDEDCSDLGNTKTIECLQYLLQKYGLPRIREAFSWWFAAQQPVEYLQFALDQKIQLPRDLQQCRGVILQAADSTEKIRLLMNRMPIDDLYAALATKGNLEGLKLAIEHSIPFESYFQFTLKRAIDSKNIDVIEFVLNEIPVAKDFDALQIIDSHIDTILSDSTPFILEYLTEKGYRWSSKHLSMATSAGNLPNMAYLIHHGCQWERLTTTTHHLAFKFAKHHGCVQVELLPKPEDTYDPAWF